MIPEIILLAIIIGWIAGGKVFRLADAEIKHVWLIFIPALMFGFAWAVKFAPGFPQWPWIYGAMHVGGIVTLIVLCAFNLKIPGTHLIVLGLLLNAIAVSVNGGFMPASKSDLSCVFGEKYLQKAFSEPHVRSSFIEKSTRLKFLCDTIPVKPPYKWTRAVCSIGDVIMTFGLSIAIIAIMRTPLPGETKKKELNEAIVDCRRE